MMLLGALALSGVALSARMAVRYFLPYMLQQLVGNSFEARVGEQSADPAKDGWRNFLEVLGGNQSKFELALRQLEEAAATAPKDIHNLYTLGRAYFYDAITHNHLDSAEKAERTFARVLELDPKHEALAFHGSVLTILSQGKDLQQFQQGVREMDRLVRRDPVSLTGRLSRGFTALAIPTELRPKLGNYDPAQDFEITGQAFEGIVFHDAPHAEFSSKAFLGESYLFRGDIANAQAAFKAALAVPLPAEPGAKAGRVVLQDLVRRRLNGSEQSLSDLLRQAGLGSCNACHLRRPETQQLSLKVPERGSSARQCEFSSLSGISRAD
jgi:tetratricopeptide (TPR) repeat protein